MSPIVMPWVSLEEYSEKPKLSKSDQTQRIN